MSLQAFLCFLLTIVVGLWLAWLFDRWERKQISAPHPDRTDYQARFLEDERRGSK
jgi:hypothetical protein